MKKTCGATSFFLLKVLVTLTLVGFPIYSLAYLPAEHDSVLMTALNDVEICSSSLILDSEKDTLRMGNRSEDTNYFRKALRFSHFFNPFKAIKPTWAMINRSTSDVRVESLVEQILSRKARWDDLKNSENLGIIIHHIQDMAVPLHVIPVNHPLPSHGFRESFESYKSRGQALGALKAEAPDCNRLSTIKNPLEVLTDLAKRTHRKVTKRTFPLVINGMPFLGTWLYFWTPQGADPKSGFGNYGILGHAFGRSRISIPNMNIEIEPKEYDSFFLEQLREARLATFDALVWYLNLPTR
jgi:hypothetical protein